MDKCLVFGATGQDGSYLVDQLLIEGYEVYAVIRKSSTTNLKNLAHHLIDQQPLAKNLHLVRGDVLDHARVFSLLNEIQPNYIFNEADQDHVAWSVDIPSYSLSITTNAVVNLLEGVKIFCPEAILFQPVSSNIFGKAKELMQHEETSLNPVSPYGIAKAATFNFCNYYREAYGLKICTGILYNHESPRRTVAYLSRKVTKAVAEIHAGKREKLQLGNLNGFIDWGYAPEFMNIAVQLVEGEHCDNFVIATGQTTKVEDFVSMAFDYCGLDWQNFVEYEQSLERPISTSILCGDVSKLKQSINRVPTTSINELIKIMIDHDMESLD